MLFASFNYAGPEWSVIGKACAFAAILTAAVFFIRRIWLGAIAGLFYGGIAGWIVIGLGQGDMTELMQMFGAPMYAVVGAAVGASAAGLGKWIGHRQQQETSHAPSIAD